MVYTLSNSELCIKVDLHGAELCSIRRGDIEYLWQADPQYWKRHSPILFPVVGSVYQNCYRLNGREYQISQHGFARDMDFDFLYAKDDELRFTLKDNEETQKKYPFPFELETGYRLDGKTIEISWKVCNTGQEIMPFQIGAHPAFNLPDFMPEDAIKGYLGFDNQDISYILIDNGGADTERKHHLTLTDGILPLTEQIFEKDALIIENSQIHDVCLYDKKHNPWLSVRFEAPVVGLWSPPKKNAPFVCIEPWYGRCDRTGYTGEFADKDWIQKLAPEEVFVKNYIIEIY